MADSDVVIRVEGLGKKYSLHHERRESYTALRDVLTSKARAAGRWLNPFTLAGQWRHSLSHGDQPRPGSEEEFWALKDVSFEIRRGERVGIIGRNGAGKSTLLKILSRITEPTTGRVEIEGRVASLLEVGTGFHPELTGRENIYLNGAILGMTRREIRSKFDEIVDFAEVEKFLDTPVKRYSSGMYVRLAFAVAAHLEPEILVVDEVLAVGDVSFQKKCLGKMKTISKKEARTVIFVSHNLSAIRSLCSSGLLLEKGRLSKEKKNISLALEDYLGNEVASEKYLKEKSTKPELAWIESVEMRRLAPRQTPLLSVGEPLEFCISYKCTQDIREPGLGIRISTASGTTVTSVNNYIAGIDLPGKRNNLHRVRIKLNDVVLGPGTYTASVSLVESDSAWLDFQQNCISFTIVDTGFYLGGRSLRPDQAIFWSTPSFFII